MLVICVPLGCKGTHKVLCPRHPICTYYIGHLRPSWEAHQLFCPKRPICTYYGGHLPSLRLLTALAQDQTPSSLLHTLAAYAEALYCLVSAGTILFNKHALSTFAFPAPNFLLFFQVLYRRGLDASRCLLCRNMCP